MKHVSENEMDDFCNRLKEEIERLGGNTTLGKKVGVDRTTIYNWCKHGNAPAHKLYELTRLGLDIHYVFTGIRDDRPAASSPGRTGVTLFSMNEDHIQVTIRLRREDAEALGDQLLRSITIR